MDYGKLSEFSYKLMCFTLDLRHMFIPPSRLLKSLGIKQGMKILDYGCGPGRHSIGIARLVGPQGKVFALDIHPTSALMVSKRASRMGLENIKAITSDCATGLEDGSLDAVILFDVLHTLDNYEYVVAELNRILKSKGTLYVNAEHLDGKEILKRITSGNAFRLTESRKGTYIFIKEGQK